MFLNVAILWPQEDKTGNGHAAAILGAKASMFAVTHHPQRIASNPKDKFLTLSGKAVPQK